MIPCKNLTIFIIFEGNVEFLELIGAPTRHLRSRGHGIITSIGGLAFIAGTSAYGYNAISGKHREFYHRSVSFIHTRDPRFLIIPLTDRDQVKFFKIGYAALIFAHLVTPIATILIFTGFGLVFQSILLDFSQV